jgi:hypothetical protein
MIGNGGKSDMEWDTKGNASTNPPNDFLGTTDNQPIVVKTAGSERLRVDTSGDVGIGTSAPAAKLHVVQGVGGTMGFPYESGVVEKNGDHKFGIYTSQPTFTGVGSSITLGDSRATNANHRFPGFEIQNVNGSVPASSYLRFNYLERDATGLVQAPNADIVRILGNGNVGIGATAPLAKLSIVAPGVVGELAGTAASTTLRTTSAAFGPAKGDNSVVASFHCPVEGNNVSLGVRVSRFFDQKTGWPSAALILSMDVDNKALAGGALQLFPNGDIGIAQGGGGIVFPDGSRQTTASQKGLQGPAGPPGPPGPAGVSPPPQVVLSRNTGGGGFIELEGPAGKTTVRLSGVVGEPDAGIIAVTDAAGAALGIVRASMSVDPSGNGTIVADIKNFRTPHPDRPDTDIVYACVEGPEAAAYVRGTARLSDGNGVISLPEHFVAVVGLAGMTVHVTPLSADSLGLAVVEKRNDRIMVKELHRGSGNYDFDWEVKGVRKNHEGYQALRPRGEISPSPVKHE